MPILDPADQSACERYDAFVRGSGFRSMTQDRAWARVKQGWGSEQVYVERDGEIVAAMSLLVKRIPGGLSLLYAPRGPVCDPGDLDLMQELVAEAAPVARRHRAFLLTMDPAVPYTAELDARLRSTGWAVRNRETPAEDLIQPRYAMILHFEDHDEESIMSKFKNKTRTMIRSSRRKGVDTVWGTDEQMMRQFYDLYVETTRRKGLNPREYSYFTRIRDAFPGTRVYLAQHEGDVLGAGPRSPRSGRLSYLYAGSADVKRNLNPNHLMNYDMIRWGISTGGEWYDFGGVFRLDESDGLYTFKNAFCRTDGPTEYIGEIDVVYRRLPAALYRRVLPRVQRLRRSLAERRS